MNHGRRSFNLNPFRRSPVAENKSVNHLQSKTAPPQVSYCIRTIECIKTGQAVKSLTRNLLIMIYLTNGTFFTRLQLFFSHFTNFYQPALLTDKVRSRLYYHLKLLYDPQLSQDRVTELWP